MTVVQAIAAAGGFKGAPRRTACWSTVATGRTTVKVAEVHVDELMKYHALQGDLRLSRFDIVYVPRGPIGNVESFSRQLFGGLLNATSLAIEGWELFNLDRVFFVPH